MDIHVMVDAIAAVMAMEDKEFYKVGELAVAVMIETASTITGDGYKVISLSMEWGLMPIGPCLNTLKRREEEPRCFEVWQNRFL